MSHFIYFYFSKFINFLKCLNITPCWYAIEHSLKTNTLLVFQNLNSRKLYRNMPLDIYNQFDTIKGFQKSRLLEGHAANGVIQYSQILVLPNLIPRNCAVCFKTSCSGNPLGYYTYKHISMVFRSDPDPPY